VETLSSMIAGFTQWLAALLTGASHHAHQYMGRSLITRTRTIPVLGLRGSSRLELRDYIAHIVDPSRIVVCSAWSRSMASAPCMEVGLLRIVSLARDTGVI